MNSSQVEVQIAKLDAIREDMIAGRITPGQFLERHAIVWYEIEALGPRVHAAVLSTLRMRLRAMRVEALAGIEER